MAETAREDTTREAWITGVGIVSCLGEGADAHWDALQTQTRRADETTHAPFVVHQIAPLDLDKQIPKKGDQRQMEAWQRIGTYAAGLALESAGIKGDKDILSRTDMIVAAGGGERDLAVDSAIMSGLPKAEKPDVFLNERLMGDLRPTLFLAQLSNLLAGNISIVHGVTGSSRTFMGEESAGIDAVRIALARINAGQSDIALVGGSYNADRPDAIMLIEFAGHALQAPFRPVWERGPNGGFALGSMGGFLVLESRAHAEARGARPIAKLSATVSDHAPRKKPGEVAAAMGRLWDNIKGKLSSDKPAVISGATGAEPATAEERQFLGEHPGIAVRATGSHLGHAYETQFIMNIALAAIAVNRGRLFPAFDGSGTETGDATAPLTQAVVTGVGHWRGEGLALVEAAG